MDFENNDQNYYSHEDEELRQFQGFPPTSGGPFMNQPQTPQGFPPASGGPFMNQPQMPQGMMPQQAPPDMIPMQMQQSASVMAVDPGAIRGCLYRYTYIWMRGGHSFWFFPVFVGRRSVAGYRWTGFNWIYFGVDVNRINSFSCM